MHHSPSDFENPESATVLSIPETFDATTFETAALLKALGHESRLTILLQLLDGEKTVSQIREHMPMSQSLVSSHLARLRHERIVTCRKRGREIIYSFSDDTARQLLVFVLKVFRTS